MIQAPVAEPGSLTPAITNGKQLVIKQQRELTEIFLGFETRNRYVVFDERGAICGAITERGGGFLGVIKRLFLKSHRGFHIDVTDTGDKPVLTLSRRFFFFFSDIEVSTPEGLKIGSAHRRFAILHKIYDLRDATGQTFARTKTPIWRIWTVNVFSAQQQELARISKKWGGVLKEMFTEADNFLVEFGDVPMTPAQRAVVFGLAISVDFDFFSSTGRNGGIIGG